MKILSLNIWGGRVYTPLIEFLEKKNNEVDIFCFQEVYDTKEHMLKSHDIRANIWQELGKVFLDYHKFYYPVMRGYDNKGPADNNLLNGLGMFVRRQVEIQDEGDYFTYRQRFDPIHLEDKDQPNNIQYVEIVLNGNLMQIYNFHGIWFPGDKLDSPERIEQSEKILEFMKRRDGSKILCGDFNLMPDTKSIALIEKEYRNLIKEFNIKETRGRLNPFYGTGQYQAYADYTFVSHNVSVFNFKVPDVEVSDHLPMILEFEV